MRNTASETDNNALLNMITPIGGLEFQKNKLSIGENLGKIYAVTKYPPIIEMGWASKITNIPNTVTCQIFEPCDNGALIEHLSQSILQNRGLAENTRDPLRRQQVEKAAEDAENLMLQIDRMGETIGYMSNLIMPLAKDESTLDRVSRTVESVI